MRERVGIYGGTFNPIHLGHLRAAEEVAEQLGLSRVLFVPSAHPPHKDSGSDDPIAPAKSRVEWVRAAVADNDRFEVDPIETLREGPSYLVDTLRTLGERLAPERPIFVVGADAFLEIETWREPKTLFTLANFAVTTRPPRHRGRLGDWLSESLGAAFDVAADGLSAVHRDAGTWIRLLEITALEISASEIRRRIREELSVRYLLPRSIHDSVHESGAYAVAPGPGEAGLSKESKREMSELSQASQAKAGAAESLAKAGRIVTAALERGALDPLVLDIRKVTSFAEAFVLLTGRSNRQVRAITDSILEVLGTGDDAPLGVEGVEEARWVLIDGNDVVVHVFDPEMRDAYALERLWSDAPKVDLAALGVSGQEAGTDAGMGTPP